MPEWRSEIRRRLAHLGLQPTRETEIVEEVAQHLDDRYRELRTSGLSDDEAAASAWRELEERDVLSREIARLERPAPLDLPPPGAPARGRWLGALWQDARYAVRTMRRSPSFALTVIFAIALSIGPTSAIVSFGNWLMWRPHPGVAEPDRLAVVWFGTNWREAGVSPSWLDYRHLAHVAEGSTFASGIAGVQEVSASLSVPGTIPVRATTSHVTANFFDVLGVRLRAGRGFLAAEDTGSGVPVAVMSEGLARSMFGTPEGALQRSILLNSRSFTVVGVAPAVFKGISVNDSVGVWIPGAAYGYMNHRAGAAAGARFYSFVVRLGKNARFDALENELNVLLRQLAESDPANARFKTVAARVFPGLGVEPLMRPGTRTNVNVMLAIGGVLLLLGCANVANLLVFRATRRQQEIAVRKALGASRRRLVQVHVLESCLLAVAGAALGLVLAIFLKELMQELLFPQRSGVTINVPIDFRVLVGTIVTALVTGLAAAAAPAWIAVRDETAAVGQAGIRTSTRAPKLRGGLASIQLALSLTLLVGALLLVTTLRNLRSVEMGFDPSGVTAMSVTLDSHGYQVPRALQYFRDVVPSLEGHREFDSVTLAYAPVWSALYLRVTRPNDAREPLEIGSNGVTHNYFSTLSIPILRGRPFTAEEALASSGEPPVIVSETLAMQLYGTLEVIGRPVRLPGGRSRPPRDLAIVGVAGDTRIRNFASPPEATLYQPIGRYEMPVRSGYFLIRSRLPTAQVGATANAIASRTDSSVPLSSVRPLSADIDRALAQERLFAWMLSLLGALGFVLASLGLYGLVSQTTIERRREFGIRLAVGAGRADIIRLVARYAFVVSAVGVVVGLGLAYWGSRMVESMLFGVSRLDPVVYIAAVATLIAVVALACIAPTLRALRVQPVEVLRAE